MRSKVLSLYLMLSIIHSHKRIFMTKKVTIHDSKLPEKYKKELFLISIKPYLCLSLSKNLVSRVPKIFEMALSIFQEVIMEMRQPMKVS